MKGKEKKRKKGVCGGEKWCFFVILKVRNKKKGKGGMRGKRGEKRSNRLLCRRSPGKGEGEGGEDGEKREGK